MATVVLYHSAVGLTDGIRALAEALQGDGHQVRTPDLYGGRTAGSTAEGIAVRDEIGITTLLARAEAALLDLPGDLVLGGASMGVAPAQLLAAQRPGTRGVLCLHGIAPPDELGLAAWPAIPLQAHLSPGDPWVEETAVDALAAQLPAELLEVHRYPGTDHLFSDPSQPDHAPTAAATLTERVREAVARWGSASTGQ